MIIIKSQSTINLFKRLSVLTTILLILFAATSGCVNPAADVASIPVTKDQPLKVYERSEQECRSSDYVVLHLQQGESYQSLAGKYLNDERLSYLISDFNNNAQLKPGARIVVPLRGFNTGGVYPDGYQTIPVLCYHRFSPARSSDKITVSEETFDRQMAYLKQQGYHVITMQQFLDFIEFRRRPPKKSVLITIDDGVKATKTIAYPILKKYGFTAVAFIITDYIKTKPNSVFLNWDELKELKDSGVLEIENHSASHCDLTSIKDEQLDRELNESRRVLAEKLGVTTKCLAYPYGLVNKKVMDAMRKYDYRLGFTVIRGGNGAFFHPLMLRRSMVYNSDKMEDFTKMLVVYNRENQ